MLSKSILTRIRNTNLTFCVIKNSSLPYATNTGEGEIFNRLKIEEQPSFEEQPKYTEEEINEMRNKSGLAMAHRNIELGRKPYDIDHEWYHKTVRYKRRMLGRYGIEACEVTPGVAWPSVEDVEDTKEYERVLYDGLNIQESWKALAEKRKQEAEEIMKRQEEIDKQMAKMDKWRVDLQAKLDKKEADLIAAKKRKEQIMEEVRQHFGYRIDPRDDRFRALMEEKELADKKRKKEAKKQKKTNMIIARLAEAEEEMKNRRLAAQGDIDENESDVKIDRKK